MSTAAEHRPPRDCPVCGKGLVTLGFGCRSCGTELVGEFEPCQFCALDDEQRDLLRLFLASRGNLREVGKHLGVSYPTARQRLTSLLVALGLSGDATIEGPLTRQQVLSEVASGALMPAEAARLLAGLPSDDAGVGETTGS